MALLQQSWKGNGAAFLGPIHSRGEPPLPFTRSRLNRYGGMSTNVSLCDLMHLPVSFALVTAAFHLLSAAALAVPPGFPEPTQPPLNTPDGSSLSESATARITATASDAWLPYLNPLQVGAVPELPPLGRPERFLPMPNAGLQTRLVIRLSDRRVYVYQGNEVYTSFPVAIGRRGWETPTGRHTVIQMQQNPVWQHPFTGELVPPGADNPLGARWIGFWTDGTNYVGLHGTPNEASVGQSVSHGCVRMYNRDVIRLFELVQIGTPVEVVP